MGRGGQSPPGVDHSPLAHGLHRKDGSGVMLASQQNIRDVLSPQFPRPRSGWPRVRSGCRGRPCRASGPRQERELGAVTPHFKGPPIN